MVDPEFLTRDQSRHEKPQELHWSGLMVSRDVASLYLGLRWFTGELLVGIADGEKSRWSLGIPRVPLGGV